MPIHLIWGDNTHASQQEIERIIHQNINPSWSTINLSRLDGEDIQPIL